MRGPSSGKNVIEWDLIESQFRHLMKVAVSVREGVIPLSTLLKRLRSGSKKNATSAAFREVGRAIRTVQLLRYLSDPALRRRVTAAMNKTGAFNSFSQWIGFGNRGVIADNYPVEQEKAMKFNALLTNAVIFHNALDIAEIVRQLLDEGWTIEPGDLAHISPYLTEHINRFGEYSTPRTRHPVRGVRGETRRRLHFAPEAGPGCVQLARSRLKKASPSVLSYVSQQ
ncbi:Tn3 family transposase [Streptomyces netropsis]